MRTRGNQASTGHRISCCVKCDIVTQCDKLFGEVVDDALGSPVQLGRHAFVQWSSSGDPQPICATSGRDLLMYPSTRCLKLQTAEPAGCQTSPWDRNERPIGTLLAWVPLMARPAFGDSSVRDPREHEDHP